MKKIKLSLTNHIACRNNLFHISGTDIVRCLSFRFQAFGRPVKNSKKFEEGIFSDLRNLKSGTDASLEEPKSPFLDFLYKNNCIRTQKKQKVFYWYSVPHDRLFLDALERDLKREKMGQEATTVAVSEPALSFEFDSSQSLFEQLTKAQQANSSSFSAHASYSSSTSPVMRAMDSMPPPQIIPHTMPVVSEDMHPMVSYAPMQMPLPAPVKQEDGYGVAPYYPERNGMPLSRPMHHQRTISMPSYLEYSPAPSFAPSEDYSARGISYEPVTPPQQMLQISEPHYLANDGYNTMPDHTGHSMNGMILPLPPVNNAPFSATPRAYSNNVYSVIEGSPTYKQRRRRSSITPGINALTNATNAATGHVRRTGDQLRRSATASAMPMSDHSDSESPSVNMGQMQPREIVDLSRHGTPLSLEDNSPAPHQSMMHQHEDSSLPPTSNCDQSDYSDVKRPAAIRRAKSATVMEVGPYPQKSHSCPIPSCGRVFKRLEHLKR